MVVGRGAWNNDGVGGTKKYKDPTLPGPYYFIGTGSPTVEDNVNDYAVWRAVLGYQRALNRRFGTKLRADGVYGDLTAELVERFQKLHADELNVWGGIGPDTSRLLFMPDLDWQVQQNTNQLVTTKMVSGTIRHESNWDAGAVGAVDENDLGLAQINGPSHPDLTAAYRLQPVNAFIFVIQYYDNALAQLKNNVRDAVASYNLGIGGARSWIKAGRPDVWKPSPTSTPRDVKVYIDSILAG